MQEKLRDLSEAMCDYIFDHFSEDWVEYDWDNGDFEISIPWAEVINRSAQKLLENRVLSMDAFDYFTADYSWLLEQPQVHEDIVTLLDSIIENEIEPVMGDSFPSWRSGEDFI